MDRVAEDDLAPAGEVTRRSLPDRGHHVGGSIEHFAPGNRLHDRVELG
jgi:hypothetical protein